MFSTLRESPTMSLALNVNSERGAVACLPGKLCRYCLETLVEVPVFDPKLP
jgi:hypothetical protein